jgi:hypothetical protein
LLRALGFLDFQWMRKLRTLGELSKVKIPLGEYHNRTLSELSFLELEQIRIRKYIPSDFRILLEAYLELLKDESKINFRRA